MEPLGHVARHPASALALRGGRRAIVAAALLTALATGEAVGQPGGLFRDAAPATAVAGPNLSTVSDSIALRRRLVGIDFGQLTRSADTAAPAFGRGGASLSGVLTLNLFDDTSFTGLVQSVAPTFSGGYSLSGPLAAVELGTMTLVVNGETVAGTVRTPEATYRIRPAGAALHVVSQIDPSRLPPLGEPIPGPGSEEEESSPLGGDGGLPVPVEPPSVPSVPVSRAFPVFHAAENALTADAQPSVETDRAALVALYDATDGDNWTDNTNWKTAKPLGEWFGVTTDAAGQVVDLRLLYNALAGPIPSKLGDLVNLRGLHLGGNRLTGKIPMSLGNLVDLGYLFLYQNELAGPIPGELVNLVNLQWLGLDQNELTGPIPGWLGSLVNLTDLGLARNELTGPISASLGSLVNLKQLRLGRNELTGPIPASLGSLVNLTHLDLEWNDLTGPIPASFQSLVNLKQLRLGGNDLTGSIPAELGSLSNLRWLHLGWNWGLSGPLAPALRLAPLERLDIFLTQTCAPAAWQNWLKMIEFDGTLCGSGTDTTIDVAIAYTQAARDEAGGVAAITSEIDLAIAEANSVYAASEVRHRLALVNRTELSYVETGDSSVDLSRLSDPSDGYMDEIHAMRDRVGADLVSMMVADADSCRGQLPGPFSLCTGAGLAFTHELGHNLGLHHDRYQVHHYEGGVSPHPAYGYVNQQAFGPSAPDSAAWVSIMAYATQCVDAGIECRQWLGRFSNPHQRYGGDPLGVPYGGGSGVTGPADAAAVLNATGPAVALWRDRPAGPNRPPTAVGTLPDRRLRDVGDTLDVDVSAAFADPDGDALIYGVTSSAPNVATVRAADTHVTLTAMGEGKAAIRVTASDPGGLSASQSFTVAVGHSVSIPFTDDPIRPGVTPVRAVHFTELRTRIDGLRSAAGLERFAWTDPILTPGVTPVRLVHFLELRSSLAAAYAAAGRPAPRWTDAVPVAGTTRIRAAQLMELRAAVVALE